MSQSCRAARQRQEFACDPEEAKGTISQPPYPESGQPGTQPGQRPDRPGPDPQQPGPPQGPGAGRAQDPNADRDDRTLAILSHLSPLIALVLSAGWLSFVGPLAMWLIFRDRSPLVRNAAATAFNFNITVWIAVIIGWVCLVTIVDRKSTRLNSSHVAISYAVFCLKK